MRKRKVLLSAGGTGGHLFPAQTVARELAHWEVLFAAGGLGSNRYFDRTAFAFEEIESATFSLSRPLRMMTGCAKILRGVRQSQQLLRSFSPDLVVGFGSFFTLPVLIAALLEKIPFILHEQNTVPGKVNRLFAKLATVMAITFPKTREYLTKRALKQTVEVLFPLRKPSDLSTEACWSYFGLEPAQPTLLIFGGSQGAARLNTLVLEAMAHLKEFQVLHFTGNEERYFEAQARYEALQMRACVKPFEPFMDRAMRIADCAITRAGASTLAELVEYELPALLIPYPYASDHHQEKNGLHFVSKVKAGKMYKEEELESSCLPQLLFQLIAERKRLKENIFEYKKERSTKQLAELIEELFDGKGST